MTRRAQGEALLARKATVERLMATGATRDEADAMVREELGHALRRYTQPTLAAYTLAWQGIADAVEHICVQLRAAFSTATAARSSRPPWQVPAGQRRRDYGLVR